jgi:hypothetical protein
MTGLDWTNICAPVDDGIISSNVPSGFQPNKREKGVMIRNNISRISDTSKSLTQDKSDWH